MKRDRDEFAWRGMVEARTVVKEHDITALPVDPMAFAKSLNIKVVAKDPGYPGVSGMLLRVGNHFGIAYATHIDSIGFQNFSVGHELGHYFIPGHVDAVLADTQMHESRAGFRSVDRYEIEADHFAALLHGPEQIADLPVPVVESPGAVRIGHPERGHLVEYLAPNSVFNSLPRQRSCPHLGPDDRFVTIDRVLHHASLGAA